MLLDKFIVHFGLPDSIVLHQGRNFENDLIKKLCNLTQIKKLWANPYHPQGNVQCERGNSTHNMIGTLDEKINTVERLCEYSGTWI